MSRRQLAVRTYLSAVVGGVTGILVGLITTPLLLRWLGDERVGAYRVAVEWVGYVALLDFGLMGGLQVALARAIARGDRQEVAAVVHAGIRGGLRLAILGGVCIFGLSWVVPYLLPALSAEIRSELQVGLWVSLLGGLWGPLLVFRPLLEASQRGYWVQWASVVQHGLTGGLLVGLAAMGSGVPGLFLATVAGSGAASLLLTWQGVRRYPEILAGWRQVVVLPSVFSGAMFIFNLCSRLSLMSDTIVIGLILGPVAAVVFTVTQRLLLVVDMQILAAGTAVWPALADLYHRGETERFNQRLIQLTRWSGALMGLLVVPVMACTPAFVTVWVGDHRYGGHLLTVATAVFVWLHGVIALWGWPLVTLGRVHRLVPVMVVGTVVNVAVSVGGTWMWGVAGPAIGSAVGYAVVHLGWMAILLQQEFCTPLRLLLQAVLLPLLIAVPLGSLLFLWADTFPPQMWVALLGTPSLPTHWLMIGGHLLVTAAVSGAIMGWGVLSKADRRELFQLLSR
jgi:O-antigen/teichoic acid export membrane protein